MKKYLFAAGIGCLLGMLFAPRKGSDLRNEIVRRYEDLQSKLEEQGKELKEETSDSFSRASVALAKAGETAVGAFSKLDKNLQEIIKKA